MIPKKLSLSNFMSYKNSQDLDFNQIDLVCISGANGVGKSSILEAITWVLWGKTRSISDDNLVYQGQQNMWVELEFEVGSSTFKAARKRSLKGRGLSELNLFKVSNTGLKNLSENSIKETQKKITAILKMPYEIFVNSAYLRQGKADEFTKKTPGERKIILGEILGLNYYENLSEKAKEKAKISLSEIDLIRLQVQDLEVEISQKDEVKKNYLIAKKDYQKNKELFTKKENELKKKEKIKKDFDKIQMELELLKEKYIEKGQDHNDLKIEEKQSRDDIGDLEKILKSSKKIEIGLKNLKKFRKENEELNKKFSKFSKLKDNLYQINQDIQTEKHKNEIVRTNLQSKKETKMKYILARIKLLKNAKKCPTCYQKITPSKSQKIVSLLKGEIKKIKEGKLPPSSLKKINKLTDDLAKIKRTIKKIDYSSQKHQKIKESIDSLEHFEDESQDLFEAKSKIKEKKKSLGLMNEKLIKIKKTLNQLKLKGKNLRDKLDKIIPKISKYDELAQQVENFKKALFESQENLLEAKSKYLQIIQAQKEVKEKKEKLRKLKNQISIYGDISKIFGKKGIQAMIISSAVPEIQDSANKILTKMSSGNLKIFFETKKQKKSDKEIIETLDIKIKDLLGSRSYEMFSGGEAFRINFAIRIALSKLLAKRAGAKLKFLAIDEGFGTQDQEGRMNLVEAIKSVKEDFEKILIITHIQELKDLFSERIDITKDETGSYINLIN